GAISLFVLYFVAARRMTPDDAGVYFLGLTFSTVLAPVSLFGLHTVALREISARSQTDQGGELRYLIGYMLKRGALLALVPATALFLGAGPLAQQVFHEPALERVLKFAAIASYAGAVGAMLSSVLQGLRCFSQSIIVLTIATPAVTAIMLALTSAADASTAAYLTALAAWVTVAVGSLAVLAQVSFQPSVVVTVPRLFESCSSLWLINVMIMAVNWSGQLIAGMHLESSDVALLAVSQRTANLVNFILIGVNFVVTPRFSAQWAKGDLTGIRSLAIQSTRSMAWIAVPIATLIALAPHRIMGFFGSEFAQGGLLLLILAAGQLFNVMTGSVNALLNMCGFDRELRNIVIVSGSLTVLLSWVLTNVWGATGCAVAITTALIVQNALAVRVVKLRLGFSMFEAILPTARIDRQQALAKP
ncbi:MAG: hypothetical protein KDA92_18680, partial [Planctomycetales bacterium]|nr:hypothetical protein [Planctomycetales bacterium]